MLITSSEVHVWHAELDRPSTEIEQLIQILAPDEKQRSERFRFEKDQKKFVVARGLLRTILARYLSLSPDQVLFSYSSKGKPTIANVYSLGELYFNVSHSHNRALYAIALNRPVGIDLEHVRPIEAIDLSQRFFLPSEAIVIRSLIGAEQHQVFFRGWTQKEAYLKATGDGLGKLASVEVALTEPMRLVSIDGDVQIAAQWFVQEIAVNSGGVDVGGVGEYTAALVVKGSQPDIHYFSI
ncbi:MAG: 4'-phosphopantetheinyl transferase superfamily protein [Timaviella obliquedivisa GSE-PSE-MK23-08B]|jgi:4'-phosphopantetheinyl transferase|nr:4'-phosphopantetheinyl transferase superfamily protein [Timaviella obliquedivisa GSE-PSE-MK23-08B]